MKPEFQRQLTGMIRRARIAALGTNRSGTASVSMVPFAFTDDLSEFHVLTSELAMHTQDMQKDNHISLLITEADDGRDDPLTLGRVELRGKAEILMVGEPGYMPAKNRYIERFPKAAPLFDFGDFRLWRISIKGGRFVAGFAKAFNLTPEALSAAAGMSEAAPDEEE
ncbi:MAG TPA: pyridoxamine 5'-phosphate oxidase family protein [Anaerolineales bacterium]